MAATELRVGLCGIGLDAYWPQFDGLHARLEGYVRHVGERFKNAGATVEHLGLVDTPAVVPMSICWSSM
jgi:L-arabinose isomerase